MTWTKFPDDGPDRLWSLSDAAFRLYVHGLVHANRVLSDGMIPKDRLASLVPRYRKADLDALVAAGLWEAGPGGWWIVGFLDDQPSRDEVLAARAANAGRQARLRDRRKRTDGGDRNGVTNGVTNGVSHGVSNAPPSRPVTTRRVTTPGEAYGREWDGFLDAWQERGLPPLTEPQRDAVWKVVDARPGDAAAWVREAPGSTGFEVIGHVLARFRAVLDAIPPDPPRQRRAADQGGE